MGILAGLLVASAAVALPQEPERAPRASLPHLWILPPMLAGDEDGVELALLEGGSFAVPGPAAGAEGLRLRLVDLEGSSRRAAWKAEGEGAPRPWLDLDLPGAVTVFAERRPARVRLEPATLRTMLHRFGQLEQAVELAPEGQALELQVRDFAKSVLRSRGASDGPAARYKTSQDFEIVPLANVLEAAPEQTLRFQVILGEDPLPGALVAWQAEQGEGVWGGILRADASGTVLLPVRRSGAIELRALHVLEAAEAGAVRTAYRASFTFRVL